MVVLRHAGRDGAKCLMSAALCCKKRPCNSATVYMPAVTFATFVQRMLPLLRIPFLQDYVAIQASYREMQM